ncbi:MAG: ABC transporter substrate-binding protein [Desulfobacterales bacterium]|nr:ABC transporter substrate-binding protein [Desulfobacterales bacterium]
MKGSKDIHPRIVELFDQLQDGRLSRREFIRYAALLGLSAAAASQMIGLPWPKSLSAADIRRGGVIRVATSVQKVTHPAQFSWVEPTNILRQVAEYLTYTDKNNITHPYLLENWKASDDLKTWILNLRKGIKFNNGDEFTADDVFFTIKQWLNKDVGSSILGMMGAYLDPNGIEKSDAHQITLHLKKPEIAVPEHLFHYPAMILNHRTFEGDFIKAPHGTGPYTLDVYKESERAVLKRRSDYWQKGADGKPLPYMDGMEFFDMGDEMSPRIAALRAGEIDMIDLATTGGTAAFQALKDYRGVQVKPIGTAQARVMRMRVDLKPWDDNRVRMALKLCQHREKILGLAYFGQGLLAHDFHVAPVHPEYCDKQIPEYNPQKAKQLLKEAGYPNGLRVNLALGSEWTDVVRYGEILKQDAAPAGFNVVLKTMPTSQYWEKWTEVDLGVTPWTHRPLGTMVLNLAYVNDADGNPVAWNETNWADPEFSRLLNEANGTLDVDERRKIFCQLEQIQWERGSIGIAWWQNNWQIVTRRVQDSQPHPTGYMLFNQTWLSEG